MTIFLLLITFGVGVLVIYAARQPDVFRIGRVRYIAASPAVIFPLMNSPREALRWSPFEKDPAMKRAFSGPENGIGAKYAWDGNNKVGAGDVEIIESVPDTRIVLRLNMLRPFKAVNEVVYELEAVDGGTEVLWMMQGKQNMIGKIMNVFIDCEKMVGRDFERGLANLKLLAEKQ